MSVWRDSFHIFIVWSMWPTMNTEVWSDLISSSLKTSSEPHSSSPSCRQPWRCWASLVKSRRPSGSSWELFIIWGPLEPLKVQAANTSNFVNGECESAFSAFKQQHSVKTFWKEKQGHWDGGLIYREGAVNFVYTDVWWAWSRKNMKAWLDVWFWFVCSHLVMADKSRTESLRRFVYSFHKTDN